MISTVSGLAVNWTLIQDRLNNPIYSGPSGLEGEIAGDTVRIHGTNSDTPPNNNDPELFWPGISAESTTQYTRLTLETDVALSGNGTGFMYGITLWESRSRYIMYGLDFDNNVPYWPSKWVAYGGSPKPDILPTWTPLAGSINNPNDPHHIKIEMDGGVTKFWFDGILLDTTNYGISNAKLRLGGFARARNDTVDATYSSISVVPEPATISALALGLLAVVRKRRSKPKSA